MVFLTGMPGCGKTYWGRQLARSLKRPFADLDEFITEHEEADISALFALLGESGFRKLEQRYLARMIDSITAETIVATGGGTPCFLNNMGMMRQAGTVVYLEATIAQLLANLQQELDTRPLLANSNDPKATLTSLLITREPYYLQADIILQTTDLTVDNFAQKLEHV